MAIETDIVTSSSLGRWGAEVYGAEYVINGQKVDFQDLMVAITTQRASVVEGEVEPISSRMTARNKRLEELGNALSDLSKAEAGFESDDAGTRDMRGDWLLDSTAQLMIQLGYSVTKTYEKEGDRPGDTSRGDFYLVKGNTADHRYSCNKKTIEGMIQKVKTQIDKLNNEASSDMTRLQSLVDRRDESYSTATSLMQAIGDCRSSLIKNM